MAEEGSYCFEAKLENEQSLDALSFTLKEYGFRLETSLLSAALVHEHVAVTRLSPGDLARSRDLEALRRRFVCSNLWHCVFLSSVKGLVRAPRCSCQTRDILYTSIARDCESPIRLPFQLR